MKAGSSLDFDEVYSAMAQRSAQFDGLWFTCVKSTKIFCRPICPAKTPMAKNVEFLPSAKNAMEAGYRPCKRCRPIDMGAQPPNWMEELRETVEKEPHRRLKDQDLRDRGLDPVAVRRAFLNRYQLTFHAYQRAYRVGQALAEIREGGDTIDAALASGFDSESGLRAAFQKILGVPLKQSADAQAMAAKWIETPLGSMLAIADDDGLALLEFVDRRMLETQIKTLMRRTQKRIVPGTHAVLHQLKQELAEYFDGTRREFSVPMVVSGTPFQEQVWRLLLQIPAGKTATYSQLARDLGRDGAQRAVGKANGDNRISILIPCHRVIQCNGDLCGYGGGLWRKKRLLELEGAL